METTKTTKTVRTRIDGERRPTIELSREKLNNIKATRPKDIKVDSDKVERYFVNPEIDTEVTVDFEGESEERIIDWAARTCIIAWQNSHARKEPERWLNGTPVTLKTSEFFTGRKVGAKKSDEDVMLSIGRKVAEFAKNNDKAGLSAYADTFKDEDTQNLIKQLFAIKVRNGNK